MNKKILFIGIIFLGILILNMPFVLGVIYNFDLDGDGTPEEDSTNLALPIYWRIGFEAYGAESGTTLPNLSVTGADSFSVDIPADKYIGSNSVYHASWGWLDDRCDPANCAPIKNRYYTFQHYPSTKHYTSLRELSPGTYNLSAIAYGAGLNPKIIEPAGTWWSLWADKSCPVPITNPVACRNPPCPSPGYYEYIESVFNPYCANMGGPTICPVCNNDPNDCTEYLSPNAYLCNGINIEIELVDNLGYLVKTIKMDNSWAHGDQVAYVDNYEGLTFITDSTPGTVNLAQTVIVTQGCSDASECSDNICKEPVCSALHECGETLVAQGGTDEACHNAIGCSLGLGLSCRCNGAGTCVGCNAKSDCPTDSWLSNYQCNGNNIERKYRTYSCVSNTCTYADTWQNTGACSPPNTVCYNPSSPAPSGCCPRDCGGGTHQCGDDDCGGSCGTCLEPTPNCNEDYTCEGTGLAYWANMNGDKIGDGSSVTHSEIGDSVLLIYKNMGAYINTYNFVISEKDGGSYDTVRTIPASETFNYRGNLAAKWIINSSEFYLKSDGLINKEAEFYFDVNGNKSNELKVNDSSTTPSNSPTVIIKEPILNSKVRVGKLLNFTQIAKDADDDLKIRWTFEDGDNSEWMYNCLTTGNCNTTHAYDSSGTKIIEIIAREMTRTQEAVNYSRVFAYAPGINVFAVITSPPFGKIFTGLSAIDVFFNASRTYIANCTVYDPGQPYYRVEDLYCYDFVKTDIPSKYNLDFNWTFSEGVGRTGRWYPEADYNRVVNFTRLFIAPTAHWAKLRVDYNPKIA